MYIHGAQRAAGASAPTAAVSTDYRGIRRATDPEEPAQEGAGRERIVTALYQGRFTPGRALAAPDRTADPEGVPGHGFAAVNTAPAISSTVQTRMLRARSA